MYTGLTLILTKIEISAAIKIDTGTAMAIAFIIVFGLHPLSSAIIVQVRELHSRPWRPQIIPESDNVQSRTGMVQQIAIFRVL